MIQRCNRRRALQSAAVTFGVALSCWDNANQSGLKYRVSAFSPIGPMRVTNNAPQIATSQQRQPYASTLFSTKDKESEKISRPTSNDIEDNPAFSEGAIDRRLNELKDFISADNQLSREGDDVSADSHIHPPSVDAHVNETALGEILETLSEESLLSDDAIMRLVSSEIGVRNFLSQTNHSLSATLQEARETILHRVPTSSNIPLDVLVSRTLDTVEDVATHLRRIPNEHGTKDLTPEEESARKTVVVLGSGWASHALMKVVDTAKIRLVVVSPTNHFLFTPMLASSAVGTVEYRSMTEAVRAANPCIHDYVEGKATDIDINKKTVTVKLNNLLGRAQDDYEMEIPYDHLVVSVGCKIDDKGVPGADKALRLKSLDDARKIRQAVGECFEFASRPDVAGPDKAEERKKRATFLIVGGGPTGVEICGELHDLAMDITRPNKGVYPNLKDQVRVILAHSGPSLVPQFEQRLRDEALKSLEKKGVEVILNTYVTEVGDDYAKLSTKQFDENGQVIGRDEYTIDTGLTVWAAGTKPVSFVDKLLEQLPTEARNKDGRIRVDKFMRPEMKSGNELGSVLVLGDAAAFPEGDEHIARDATLPQTAQVAGQQGAYVARLLNRGYQLDATPPALPETLPNSAKNATAGTLDDPILKDWLELRDLTTADPFVFLNLGILAYLGGGEALSQVQLGDVPIFSYFGSVAFVLWRSVYLVKQVATRNRVLVTFDWIKSAIFGRDMTRF